MERIGIGMNVRNCKKCGRIFNYVSGMPICPSCREDMEKKFQEVKDYIREHKEAGITEVAEACEVEVRQIKQGKRRKAGVFSRFAGRYRLRTVRRHDPLRQILRKM